jgi:hypothetical protein
MQMRTQHPKLPLALLRHFPKHQALTRVVQDRHIFSAHLFQNPMRQSAKTQYINIHDDMPRMLHHQIHLCLHGELIRHDEQIIGFRTALRCLDHIVMKPFALAGA